MKRANGKGSVSFDKYKNKYVAKLYDPDGKRISAQFATEEEAEAWLIQKQADMYKGMYTPLTDCTVGNWAIEYLETYAAPTVRPRTLMIYQDAAKKLKPIAKIKLRKLTAIHIQRFYNNMEASSDGKLKVHKFLRLILNKAFALDMIPKNPMAAVNPPKHTPPEIETFTIEEIQKLLDFLKDHRYYKKYYPMIYTAVHTGARLGELLALKTRDIHEGYITINATIVEAPTLMENEPKTKQSRRKITISKENEELLRGKDKLISFDGYILHTNTGTPIGPSNFQRAWRGILAQAGIPHKHFHALRHTHATQLLASGIPILEVSRRLGHANPSITLNRYGHAIKGYDETLPEKISKIFGS